MNYNTDTRISLTPLKGTPFVYLSDDANMARAAKELGTIVVEREIAALPEVKALGPDDLVLDVGAFIGDTALIFAANGAQVVGFEAQEDAYTAAVINTRAHPNIKMRNQPVGNAAFVWPACDPTNGNLGTRTVREGMFADAVQAVPLDYFLSPKRVTFLKIDVEGYEPAVLQGANQLIQQDRPIILVEIYPAMLQRQGFTPEDVTGPLLGMGYQLREAIGNSSEPRWDILATPL